MNDEREGKEVEKCENTNKDVHQEKSNESESIKEANVAAGFE